MILGGKAIDHPSRGGLGHCPCGDGHWMAELGILMDRIDQCMAGPPKGGIFGIQLVKGSFDSDDETDYNSSGSCGASSVSFWDAADVNDLTSVLTYDGPPTCLGPEEGAWFPVKLENRAYSLTTECPEVCAVLPVADTVEVATGLWEPQASTGFVFGYNAKVESENIEPGQVVGVVEPVVVQTRHCGACDNFDTDAWSISNVRSRQLPGKSACRACGAPNKYCSVPFEQGCEKKNVSLAAGQPDAGLIGAADVATRTVAPGLPSSGCSAKVGKTLFISDKALEQVLSTAGDS